MNNSTDNIKKEELPSPMDEFTDLQLEHIVELMKEPNRAISSCVGKKQLQKLCRQLLAENLTLQTKIQNLEKDIARIRMSKY